MNAISHALDLTKQSDEAFDFDFIIQLILRMNLDTYEVVKALNQIKQGEVDLNLGDSKVG